MLDAFFDLPWPNIAGFLTCTALILFTFGPKFPFVVKFFAKGFQEMIGITALRLQLYDEHDQNSTRLTSIEDKIDRHEKDDAIHRRNSDVSA